MKRFHRPSPRGQNAYGVTPGIRLEQLGDRFVVHLPATNEVIQLNGPLSEVLSSVLEGHVIDARSNEDLQTLIRIGIVENRQRLSRRGFLGAATGGAIAGVTVLAMPAVATASSIQCPTITVSNADNYNGSQPAFRIDRGSAPPGGPTDFDVETWGLPVGTYYYRATAQAVPNGGPAGFVYQGQFDISTPGEYRQITADFSQTGEYPTNYPVSAELFSDPNRQCLIPTTTVIF